MGSTKSYIRCLVAIDSNYSCTLGCFVSPRFHTMSLEQNAMSQSVDDEYSCKL